MHIAGTMQQIPPITIIRHAEMSVRPNATWRNVESDGTVATQNRCMGNGHMNASC